MNHNIQIIFPHQLFADSPLIKDDTTEVYLIEEFLYFRQYNFHKQKLAFHRASMKSYQHYLEQRGISVQYIDSTNPLSDIRVLLAQWANKEQLTINVIDPVDYWLEKRLRAGSKGHQLNILTTPQFINTNEDLATFFKVGKKNFFQTSFYKQQRVKHGLLLDEHQGPLGGQWTYDIDNRKKYPKDKTPPNIYYPKCSTHWQEAVQYISDHFSENIGELSDDPRYPIDHTEAQAWLEQFLNFRFFDFGIYEDAIVQFQSVLNHSLLSPLLNTGLILPRDVLNQSIKFANNGDIPINSTEGFVRQILGWREFIRGMYACKGVYSRTNNYWQFTRKIPASFYDGTTGILPVDDTIKMVLKTGYCHHIERLMILGNFMLLCEFDPDEVYRWFMELFIDAFDWVMVPNVYGMSQFADGGTFATKPYIGGSNYIKKMSNYPKGDWEHTWDGLFWRFIAVHQDFFKSNPRLSMMTHTYHKMTDDKKQTHMDHAEAFIAKLEQ